MWANLDCHGMVLESMADNVHVAKMADCQNMPLILLGVHLCIWEGNVVPYITGIGGLRVENLLFSR